MNLEWILSGVFVVVWGIYTYLRIRFNLHMLQLNSYRNERYIKWFQENKGKVFQIRDFIPLLSLVLLNKLPVISFIFAIVIYLFYIPMEKQRKEKKKFAVTSRVKRLYTTVSILVLLLIIAGLATDLLLPFLITFTIVTFIITILANVINSPIEKRVHQYYINDANNIIKGYKNLTVVGITGSYGKTSVKNVLNTVLSSNFNTLMTPESYNTPMGNTITIRNSLRPIHQVYIAEMGAKQKGDIKEICDIVEPKIGIITSIGPQHLETFGNIDTVIQTKFELIESLPSNGIGILNFDDPNIKLYKVKNTCKIIYFGIDSKDVHYKVENLTMNHQGSTFTVSTYKGQTAEFTTKLLGKHNISNIVAAISVGLEMGIPIEKLQASVRKVKPVKHRLELKKNNGINIIDDSFNSNPVGSKMALEVLNQMPGQKIIITPGMVELGSQEFELNKEFGRSISKVCDYTLLVGKKQTVPIQEGLKEENYPNEKLYVATNLEDALSHLNKIVETGAYVLLENDLPDTYNEE